MDIDANRDPDMIGEPMVVAPVMDGAEELQAEAAEAVASGEVDPTDTRHGGPPLAEERPGRD